MTAHDPRVTLTEAERTWLRLDWPHASDGSIACMCIECQGSLMRAVERIIDARLAPIRALADESHVWVRAEALRTALDAASADLSAQQDHDGAEGQGEGEKAAGDDDGFLDYILDRSCPCGPHGEVHP